MAVKLQSLDAFGNKIIAYKECTKSFYIADILGSQCIQFDIKEIKTIEKFLSELKHENTEKSIEKYNNILQDLNERNNGLRLEISKVKNILSELKGLLSPEISNLQDMAKEENELLDKIKSLQLQMNENYEMIEWYNNKINNINR